MSKRNEVPQAIVTELSCPLHSPLRLGGPRHGAYGKEAVSGPKSPVELR